MRLLRSRYSGQETGGEGEGVPGRCGDLVTWLFDMTCGLLRMPWSEHRKTTDKAFSVSPPPSHKVTLSQFLPVTNSQSHNTTLSSTTSDPSDFLGVAVRSESF